ncbi:SpaH/EbpB family LPXTG-anchored major pilin [Pseudobutyrivibrio sp.]|uniref:SpaH/EbpB family LPXTG-anchored major pilin n=1 Tax=Pseudobutyrivibrio sp. TaxID=2014367 RepID=UPI001B6DB13F|nr:SpaH/EbpB family LPXTG-anchored major pilin [Pseudobutyrivibrio sp.]MBP3262039.1 SpaH/EbpB family LPXTG-anchored major pilin [Pseudobutyrivibrio sp.]
MNKMKKIIAFALMMVMMMAMSVTAFAAEATITVENADNATLTYAQVIVADQTTSSGWEIVSGYEAAFQKLPGMENVTDTQKLIEAYENAKESEKAEALANISTNKVFTNGMTVTSAGLYVINATEEGFTYKTMAAYVGFDEKTGEQKGLTPATLKAKKEPTQVGKTADEKYVEINDEITYTLKSTIPYVPEDKIDGDTTTSSEVTLFAINDKMTGGKYKVETEGENAGKLAVKISYGTTEKTVYVDVVNNGFKLNLSELVNKQNTNANLELTAKYTAIATSLEINNNAYPTVLNHDYDIDKDSKDITTKITSFSGKINLVKVDAKNTSTKLAGAEFVIGKKNTDGSVVYAKLENGQLVGWTSNKEANGEEAGASHITTDENGEAGAAGFDKDITTYFVEEVVAPQGYALNNTKYPIKWNESVAIEAVQEGTTDSAIPNTKLGQLPFTGGMGTTIFTVLGVALMAIAAALYFATKKTAKN